MAVSSIPLLVLTENISQDGAPTVAHEVAPGNGKINAGFYAPAQAQDKENAPPMGEIDKSTSQSF